MIPINNEDSKQKKSKEDYDAIIEELNKEIKLKQAIINDLNIKLYDANTRVRDMIEKNNLLESRINEFELKDLSMKFGKFEELKDNYNKLDHRTTITKKHLDTAREDLKFTDVVILDFKNRGFIDLILRRYPESYLRYKTEITDGKK